MLRERLSKLLPTDWLFAQSVLRRRYTLAEDGLVSWHNSDFVRDERFRRAYEFGKATGSWHGADIHWRAYIVCWAASRAANLEGDFVECGVNKGGFAGAVVTYLDFGNVPKVFWLVDTFQGVPEKFRANAGPGNPYSECYEQVQETFRRFPNVRLVRGMVPDILTGVTSDKVCFLSIDMNSPEPERASLEYFWDKLVPGATVILDDYGFSGYERQKISADEFAAQHKVQVLTLPTGQGMIVKP